MGRYAADGLGDHVSRSMGAWLAVTIMVDGASFFSLGPGPYAYVGAG